MNNYLAKSNPKQSIQEHTNNLIKNLFLLQEAYPCLEIDWDMLRYACIYHDLGKMNIKFQNKIEFGKRDPKEIPHGILSLPFIDYVYLEEKGFSEEQIKIIFQSVAYHHNRDLNFTEKELEQEIKLLEKEFSNFKYDEIEDIRFLDSFIEPQYFVKNERIYRDNRYFFDYVKIKGLLNRLDYAASSDIKVETKNDFLIEGLNKLGYKWNELQLFMKENSKENVVVVAQTGMGKTEAGLLWIGNNKGFFTLPLKTAINEIYKRIVQNIVGKESKTKIGLLHSDTYSKYLENKSDDDNIDEYYNKTRQLSLPLTICTLDQLFDFVFRYKDFEPKLATLAYSKVIIDEVQMYSADLLAYLIFGLSFIDKIGGSFAIMTATLPGIVIDLMKKEGIRFKVADKPFINHIIRHSVKIVDSQIDSGIIASKFNNNRILVICNTVKKSQQVYNELCENQNLKNNGVNINLLHSKFIKRDRKIKEEEIMTLGSKECKDSGIWVSTQIVEASLDIDFDLLFTELSDINGLFQRFGRCFRKREFNMEGYNCFVFNGGEQECSGVTKNDKSVIDINIFNFSKQALKNIDGRISENQKLKLIDEVYSTEKLKDTQYYKKVDTNINYLKNINEYEFNKAEIKERFRNIDNVIVIPKCIYDENKELIEDKLNMIRKEVKKEMSSEEIILLKETKIISKQEIINLTLDVYYYEYLKCNVIDKIKLNQFEEIPIIELDYSFEVGAQVPKTNSSIQNSCVVWD